MKDADAMFEMQLAGGYRVFWSTITPTVYGRLQTVAAPAFCRAAEFPERCDAGTPGIWDLWPIKNPARPHPLEEADRLCRPVQITAGTPGVALISLQHEGGLNPNWLWLELFLSETEPGPNGRSVFEEWADILRTTKDDVSMAAVLRLNLGTVTPDEIAGFKSHKKLVATDITLDIRQLFANSAE